MPEGLKKAARRYWLPLDRLMRIFRLNARSRHQALKLPVRDHAKSLRAPKRLLRPTRPTTRGENVWEKRNKR
eukprot:6200813-Pleurochrysis_carterae.AAC.4